MQSLTVYPPLQFSRMQSLNELQRQLQLRVKGFYRSKGTFADPEDGQMKHIEIETSQDV